jgi:hypothetical protein
VPVPLPDELLDLLGRPSLCFVATIMPDGSPQLTQTWASTFAGPPAGGSLSGVRGGRGRPDTLRAVACDLKAFFAVITQDPAEVTGAGASGFPSISARP